MTSAPIRGVTPAINILALTAGGEDGPAIGIGIRDLGGIDSWALLRFIAESDDPANPDHTLANLGPVLPGEFNTAFIHIDNATDLVRVNWNGAEVYNQVTPADWGGGVGFPEWGASNFWAEGGTSTVAYDWVGYGPGYIIPEPSSLALALAGSAAVYACRQRKRRPAVPADMIRRWLTVPQAALTQSSNLTKQFDDPQAALLKDGQGGRGVVD